MLEVQIGVGGGTRMPTGYATAMFALTCVVSCGLSWSWGSFIWTVPGWKIHSAGQVVVMALVRPNAVLPDDAAQAEECHPRVLCDVNLVMIDIGRRVHV
jgi:hypothetical protein